MIYHPAEASFSFVDLPVGMESNDVAYLRDATLGVALSPLTGSGGELLIVSPLGVRRVVSGIEAVFVMDEGGRFLTGQVDNNWVSEGGVASAAPSDTTGRGWLAYPSTHPTWPLPGGNLVSLSEGAEGLELMSDSGDRDIQLARRSCPLGGSGSGFGGAPGDTQLAPTTTQVCHSRVAALAVVGNSAWFLEQGYPFIWRVSGL